MNYSSLYATIALNIYENHRGEVTAEMVKAACDSIVNSLGFGYQFRGAAAPGDAGPGSIDQRVFYIASTPGTYSGFGGLTLAANEVALLKWDTEWHKETLDIPSKTQIMARLATQDGNIAALDSEVATFEAAVRYMVENYPNITINGDVVNAPDGEDITTDENDLLKFANRPALFGMGYIILRKNKTFAEQVTQQNTIYEIRYDFALDADFTMPDNCILKFNGGSIRGNYSFIGRNTYIDGKAENDITFIGSFKANGNLYEASTFGVLKTSTSVSARLQALSKVVSASGGGIIVFEAGTYYIGSHLEDGTSVDRVRIYPNVTYRGAGIEKKNLDNVVVSPGTKLKGNNNNAAFHSIFASLDATIENVCFEDIEFDTYIGTINTEVEDKRMAITIHAGKNIFIRNCKFTGDFSAFDFRYSHDQTDKNNGDYKIYHLVVENCEFAAKSLSVAGYKDMTYVGITAQDYVVRNNVFHVVSMPPSGGFVQNCALEIQGKNIDVYGNIFEGFTNAIDVNSTDKHSHDKNINIYNNAILTNRGVALWTDPLGSLCGVNIYSNYFELSVDYNYHHDNAFNAICIAKHIDNQNGNFHNIVIRDNVFDYSKTYSYYQSLDKATWESNHAVIMTDYGYCFEDYYSCVALTALGIATALKVENNIFKNCVLPSVFIGGSNYTRNTSITNNTFIDCGYSTFGIISLVNFEFGTKILDNAIIDTTSGDNSDILFLSCGWIGHECTLSGYPANASACRFFNTFLLRNFVLRTNSTDSRKIKVDGINANGGILTSDLSWQTNGQAPSFVPKFVGQFAASAHAFYLSQDTQDRNSFKTILRGLYGDSAHRPASVQNINQDIGIIYFDTTLGKPIWWSGTKWVLADGSDA